MKESLEPFANVVLFNGRELSNHDLIVGNADILFTRSQTKIDESLLKNTKVKLIATATTGTDHIDDEYLNNVRIPFYDAGGCNSNSVAEFVVFSILKWALEKRINLSEKKIGIIGFGRIGKLVARYSSLLGLAIFVNDPPLFTSNYNFPADTSYLNLEDLFAECDIITNHVPLIFSGKHPTFNLIGCELVKLMKPDALFIHHSRGGVVDDSSLLTQKNEKKLYLSIDVWNNEPDFNVELAYNCEIATPHISGYSYDGKLNGTLTLLKIFESFTGITPNFNFVLSEISKTTRKGIANFNSYGDLIDFINGSRKFTEDILNFKNMDCSSTGIKSKNFDLLRKNYPLRRECLSAS